VRLQVNLPALSNILKLALLSVSTTPSQSHHLANHKYSQFCHQTTRKLTDDDDDDDTVTALLHSAIDDAETIKKYTPSLTDITTTILRPFFRDHPGQPVPEVNFWTLRED